MPTYKKLKFVIDAYTPLTIPIGRLAEYLRQFAGLVGPVSDVHFCKVAKGSATLECIVPEDVVSEVRARVLAARLGAGPAEAIKGFEGIRRLLYEDKSPGRVKEGRAKIIEFPKPHPVEIGPVTEEGAIEGMLIKLGGRDETIPVHLQDGSNYYKCVTTRAIAKSLAPFLFGDPIRVLGRGKWIRTEQGEWELQEFRITNFEQLNNDEIKQVLARMREASGSGWNDIADPLGELQRIRRGGRTVQ